MARLVPALPSHEKCYAAHGKQSQAQRDGQAAAEDAHSTPRPPLNHQAARELPGRYRPVRRPWLVDAAAGRPAARG